MNLPETFPLPPDALLPEDAMLPDDALEPFPDPAGEVPVPPEPGEVTHPVPWAEVALHLAAASLYNRRHGCPPPEEQAAYLWARLHPEEWR